MVKKIHQYEICLINLDPSVGSEMKKTRPCIILSPDEMNDNLKSLMEAPAKRYDTIVVCVITAVIGAIVGFALSGIFPA